MAPRQKDHLGKTSETIMTRLSCGTTTQLAWLYLSSRLDAATAVTDAEAFEAARVR